MKLFLLNILRSVLFDLKSSSSRSFFNIYWITIGFSLFVFVKSFIFSEVLNQIFTNYTLFLSSSLAIWYFLSGITTGGCSIYTGNKIQLMMQIPKNYFLIYLYCRKSIEFFLQLLVYLFFSVLTLEFNIIGFLLFLLNLIILMLVLYPFVMNLAYLSLLSKDFSIFIGYLIKVFFFITPVIWGTNMISEKYNLFLLLNPYYHFLEILRNPLLDNVNSFIHYKYLLIFFIINFSLFLYLSKKIPNHELYIA